MFKKFFIKTSLSKNKKNIMKISSGTILGQIISLASLPIITRIYGPEIIGTWAFLNSIAILVNSMSDLGLTNSIMIESKKDVEKTYKIINTVSLFISLILSVLVTFFYNFFIEEQVLNSYLFFIFIMLISFLTLQIQVSNTWLNRNENYNLLMKNPIINNGTSSFLAILIGLLGFISYGYFLALIIGQLLALLNMKKGLPKFHFSFVWKDMKSVLLRNKRFVIYQTPTNIISSVQNQLPIFLIKFFWGAEMLGYYVITVKVLKVPSMLLAKSIGRVFFQVTSKMKMEEKPIGSYVLKNLISSMWLAIIPLILLIAFGDILLVIILGDEWKIAGEFIRVIALQYFFVFLMGTVQGLSIVLEKQNYALLTNIFQAIGYIIGATIGFYVFDDIFSSLLIMSIMYILIQIIYFSSMLKFMEVSVKKYILSTTINIIIILTISFTIREIFNFLIIF